MRQPVLRAQGPRASKVVALRKPRARRKSQTSAATRLRERRRERRPRGPETVRRQASAGEARLRQEPLPTRMICKRGGPSARPFARASPPLAASREARAISPRLALGVECRVRRREPSTAPPHARRPRANYAHARGRRPIFPMRERDQPPRSAVDLRRLSARQPTMRR